MGADLKSHVNSHVKSHGPGHVNWTCENSPPRKGGHFTVHSGPPEIGEVVRQKGQPYRFVRSEPYERKADGAAITLLVWSSNCASCDTPFETRTPRPFGYFSRRCSKCARPGKLVEEVKASLRMGGKPEERA